jgi:hypothetical protein
MSSPPSPPPATAFITTNAFFIATSACTAHHHENHHFPSWLLCFPISTHVTFKSPSNSALLFPLSSRHCHHRRHRRCQHPLPPPMPSPMLALPISAITASCARIFPERKLSNSPAPSHAACYCLCTLADLTTHRTISSSPCRSLLWSCFPPAPAPAIINTRGKRIFRSPDGHFEINATTASASVRHQPPCFFVPLLARAPLALKCPLLCTTRAPIVPCALRCCYHHTGLCSWRSALASPATAS